MAKTYKGLKIVLGADITTLQQALRTVNKDAKTFANELSLINSSLKLNPTSTELLHQKMELLSKSAETAREKFQKLSQARSQLAEKHNSGTLSDEQWRAYNRELERARANLQSFEHQIEVLNTISVSDSSAPIAQNAEVTAEAFEKIKDDAEKVASTLTKATLAYTTALITVLTKATQAEADFEEAMSSVVATMGTDSSSQDYAILSEQAKQLGEATKFSATQSANALQLLAQAGYSTKEQLEGIGDVLNLASSGEIELAESAQICTTAMSALGLSTKDLKEFSDKVAVASQATNSTVSSLGEGFNAVGGTAKILVGGLTEISTALGILSDAGIQGAEGGNSLRQLILNLTTPTNEAKKKFEELGVSAFDASGNMRPLNEIFRDLSQAMNEFSDKQKMEALGTIFDARQLKSANALLANCGERWDELTTKINNSQGASEKMADTMIDNLKGDVTILKSALEGIGITVEESFSSAFRDAVQTASEAISIMNKNLQNGQMAEKIRKMSDAFGVLISQVTDFAVKSVFPALVDSFTWVLTNGETIKNTIVAIGVAFATWKFQKNVILDLQKAFIALAMEVKSASSAIELFKNIASSPMGITVGISATVTAIVALIGHIKKLNELAEETRQKNIDSGLASASKYSDISELSSQYERLKNITSRTAEQETAYKEIQEQIITQLGDRAKALETLTYGTDEYTAKLEEMTEKEKDQYEMSIAQGLASAKQALEQNNKLSLDDIISFSSFSTDKEIELAEEIKNTLYDSVNEAFYDSSSLAKTQYSLGLLGSPTENYETLSKAIEALNSQYERYIENGDTENTQALLNSKAYTEIKTSLDEYTKSLSDYYTLSAKQAEINYVDKNGFPQTEKEYESLKSSVLEAVSAQSEFSDTVISAISPFKSLDTAVSTVASDTTTFVSSVSDISDELSELAVSLSDVQKNSSLISSALKEFSENGELSSETALKLVESGYSLALQWDNETGKCLLLKDVINDITNAKYSKIQADIAEKQNSLQEQYDRETKSLESLRTAISSVTDAREYYAKQEQHNQTEQALNDAKAYAYAFNQALKEQSSESAVSISALSPEELIQNVKNSYELGKISATDYYRSLSLLNDRYYKDDVQKQSEYQKNLKEIYSGAKTTYKDNFEVEKEWLDYYLTTNQLSVEDYYTRLEQLATKYFAGQKGFEAEYSEYVAMVEKGRIDAKIQSLKDEKSALQTNNEQQQKALDIEKARTDLENARNNKKRVYSSETGFTYETDTKAVQDAEQKLNNLLLQEQLDAYDRLIDVLEETSESIASVPYSEIFSFDNISSLLSIADKNISLPTEQAKTNNQTFSMSVNFGDIKIDGTKSPKEIAQSIQTEITEQFNANLEKFLRGVALSVATD